MSDTESVGDNVQKKKAAKKKKKVKLPKGPKRWDEVNVEADKRYFDVSDNIESGSGNVVSLSDQEPAPSNQVQDGANPALADYSRLDLLDPITQQMIPQSTLQNMVESSSQLEAIHISSPMFDPVVYLTTIHKESDSQTFIQGI